uniref:Uncharacterized protein n=1 Tax=Arundo donax TaxID=35708 RepID=A0A0A8Z207_ARUDO
MRQRGVLGVRGVEEPREVAGQVGDDVQPGADGDAHGDHIVEVEVVVEGHHPGHDSAVADPGDGVPAHG